MNFKIILKTLGRLLKVEAFLMLLPLIFTIIYKEQTYLSFIIPAMVLFLLGYLLSLLKVERKTFYAKEGFVLVGLSWIIMSLFGCLPFIISKSIPSFVDAFFETVSGFTTTGASIVTNIDDWYEGSKSLLFWRSFTHWIGGMGVLVFILAILPSSEGQNIFILRAESTGPQVGKLVSKIKVTARILYLIYLVLTLIEAVLLTFDMPLYDSIVHALATAGTGGFGIRGNSIGYYSTYCQMIIAIFMFLFGINFNIFYLLLIGKFKQVFKSEEVWWYIGIVISSVLIIATNLYFSAEQLYDNIALSLKDSFFQVASIITTTGFATVDFIKWPAFSQFILFLLMFVGGCAGSTAGGIKVSRIAILFKSLKREFKKILHPNSVSNIRFEGTTLEESVVKGVCNYFSLIMVILFAGTLVISLNGFDFQTNFTAMTACINNIGPGLGSIVGPMGSFANFNWFSKLVFILAMLIGRLEIYPILILFNPKIWRKKS